MSLTYRAGVDDPARVQRPALERAEPVRPRQQRVRRVVQRGAHGRVPDAGDPASDICLSRLVSRRRQAKERTHHPGIRGRSAKPSA